MASKFFLNITFVYYICTLLVGLLHHGYTSSLWVNAGSFEVPSQPLYPFFHLIMGVSVTNPIL